MWQNVFTSSACSSPSLSLPSKASNAARNNRALNRGPVAPEGPQFLPTTGDLGAVALNTHNPHELWSRDAGDFFCNEIYYRTLYKIRQDPSVCCFSSSDSLG